LRVGLGRFLVGGLALCLLPRLPPPCVVSSSFLLSNLNLGCRGVCLPLLCERGRPRARQRVGLAGVESSRPATTAKKTAATPSVPLDEILPRVPSRASPRFQVRSRRASGAERGGGSFEEREEGVSKSRGQHKRPSLALSPRPHSLSRKTLPPFFPGGPRHRRTRATTGRGERQWARAAANCSCAGGPRPAWKKGRDSEKESSSRTFCAPPQEAPPHSGCAPAMLARVHPGLGARHPAVESSRVAPRTRARIDPQQASICIFLPPSAFRPFPLSPPSPQHPTPATAHRAKQQQPSLRRNGHPAPASLSRAPRARACVCVMLFSLFLLDADAERRRRRRRRRERERLEQNPRARRGDDAWRRTTRGGGAQAGRARAKGARAGEVPRGRKGAGIHRGRTQALAAAAATDKTKRRKKRRGPENPGVNRLRRPEVKKRTHTQQQPPDHATTKTTTTQNGPPPLARPKQKQNKNAYTPRPFFFHTRRCAGAVGGAAAEKTKTRGGGTRLRPPFPRAFPCGRLERPPRLPPCPPPAGGPGEGGGGEERAPCGERGGLGGRATGGRGVVGPALAAAAGSLPPPPLLLLLALRAHPPLSPALLPARSHARPLLRPPENPEKDGNGPAPRKTNSRRRRRRRRRACVCVCVVSCRVVSRSLSRSRSRPPPSAPGPPPSAPARPCSRSLLGGPPAPLLLSLLSVHMPPRKERESLRSLPVFRPSLPLLPVVVLVPPPPVVVVVVVVRPVSFPRFLPPSPQNADPPAKKNNPRSFRGRKASKFRERVVCAPPARRAARARAAASVRSCTHTHPPARAPACRRVRPRASVLSCEFRESEARNQRFAGSRGRSVGRRCVCVLVGACRRSVALSSSSSPPLPSPCRRLRAISPSKPRQTNPQGRACFSSPRARAGARARGGLASSRRRLASRRRALSGSAGRFPLLRSSRARSVSVFSFRGGGAWGVS